MARLEVLREKIRRLEDDVRDSRDDQVSKQEFEPVKRLIYGLVSVILLAVITAILALVLSGKMP
jgi:thiosulfate reductase cytochrome b subunit